MSIRSGLTWVRPFLVLVLVVTVPLVLYWFGYVNRSVENSLRQFNTTIAAVGTSLEERLQALDQIAQTAEKLPEKENGYLSRYLLSLIPYSTATVASDGHHLRLTEDENGLLLTAGYPSRADAADAPKPPASVSVKLESLIRWDIVQAEFDGLVVLSPSGRLLAQDRRMPAQARGLPIYIVRNGQSADLSQFFPDSAGKGDPATIPASRPPSAEMDADTSAPGGSRWRSPTDFSGHDSITIAGTRYLAFLQPVRVYTTDIESPEGRSGVTDSGTVDLLVAGLVAEDRLRREAQKLSPQTLARVFAIVGLGLFLIPLLKLRFIGANERMRYRDVWIMFGAMLGITAVIVLLVLDGSATKTMQAGLDEALVRLHDEIGQGATKEAVAAIVQLEAVTQLPNYCEALGLQARGERASGGAAAGDSATPASAAATGGAQAAPCVGPVRQPDPKPRDKGALLLEPLPISYPLLDTVFLATARDLNSIKAGHQVYKWNPRTIPTGRTNVRTRGYFNDAMALRPDGSPGPSLDVSPMPAAREFIVSMTSGQEQMAFAMPVSGTSGEAGAAVPPAERTHVAAITTPMRSLSRTVVPSPFEYVLVARDGTVTFRNARGPYLKERFFEQVKGGAVLAATSLEGGGGIPGTPLAREAEAGKSGTGAKNGASEVGDFSYRWRNYRMHASDVPALEMTLVTFYDADTARALAARAFGVAAAVALAAILSSLVGALLAALLWGRAAHDWLWPGTKDTGRYVIGIAGCAVVVVLLLGIRLALSPGWFAVGLLVFPGLVTFLCGSPLWFRYCALWQPKDDSPTQLLHKAAFCGFLLSLLLALVAVPTLLAFDDGLRLFSAAYQRVSALQWSKDADKSAQRFETDYAKVDAGKGPTTQGGPPGPGCNAPDRICANGANYVELERTLTHPPGFEPGEWGVYSGCPNPMPTRLEGGESLTRPADCRLAIDRTGRAALPWSFTAVFARPLAVLGAAGPEFVHALDRQARDQADRSADRPFSGWTWSRWLPALLVCGLVFLVLIVRSVAVHVLGLGWRDQLQLGTTRDIEVADGTRWLVLQPTQEDLDVLSTKSTQVVDLSLGGSAGLAAPAAGRVLLVLHAEQALTDKSLQRPLLQRARAPADGCLIYCAEIDPLYYVSQQVREALDAGEDSTAGSDPKADTAGGRLEELRARRTEWTAVMRGFHKVRGRTPKFPELDKRLPEPVRRCLVQECRSSGPLVEIAVRLAKSPDLAQRREDEVVELVLDAAEPYYRWLWELCSEEERMVLVQLAEEGVANPKQFHTLRQLNRRGLIVVDPRFQLMNESFRQFVRSVESPQRVKEWERTPAGLSWRRFSTPLYTLAAVMIAILLYTQQEVFLQMLAIATGAATALNSLRGVGLLASNVSGSEKEKKAANV